MVPSLEQESRLLINVGSHGLVLSGSIYCKYSSRPLITRLEIKLEDVSFFLVALIYVLCTIERYAAPYNGLYLSMQERQNRTTLNRGIL